MRKEKILLIKRILNRHYPKTKFSVSLSAAKVTEEARWNIDISWKDGPTTEELKYLMTCYEDISLSPGYFAFSFVRENSNEKKL